MLQDIRYAVRALLQNRNFTVVALLALALGIGANTGMFSVVYAVLLRPLPYRQPDRLVWIALHDKRLKAEMVSVPDFLDWRSQSHSFESMAAFMPMDQTLTGDDDDPIEVRTMFYVKPTDSLTYAAVSIVVLAITAIAAWLPARRAGTIDPTTALRYE